MTAGKQEKIIPLVSGWFGKMETTPYDCMGRGSLTNNQVGNRVNSEKSKSRITLLCPITPDAAHLGPITNHAEVPSRVTETPFTTLIFHMRCVANRHDRGHDRDLLRRGREFPSAK